MAFAGHTGSVRMPQKVLVCSFYSSLQKLHTKYKDCFVVCQRMMHRSIGRFMTTEIILVEKKKQQKKINLREKMEESTLKIRSAIIILKFSELSNYLLCTLTGSKISGCKKFCLLNPDYFTVNLIQL